MASTSDPTGSQSARIEVEAISSLTEFAAALRLLRVRAGSPTYRQLEAGTRHSKQRLARNTISRAMKGQGLVKKEFALALVRAFGADGSEIGEWERAWERVALTQDSARTPPRPSEAAELREETAALRQMILEQRDDLARLRAALARPSTARAGSTGGASGRGVSPRLAAVMEHHMEMGLPQAAQEVVKEKAAELAQKLPFLERELIVRMEAAVSDAARAAVEEMAADVARRSSSHLEPALLMRMEAYLAEAGREALGDIARRIVGGS